MAEKSLENLTKTAEAAAAQTLEKAQGAMAIISVGFRRACQRLPGEARI